MTCQREHWRAAHARARLYGGLLLGLQMCVEAHRPSSSEAGAFSCAGVDGWATSRPLMASDAE